MEKEKILAVLLIPPLLSSVALMSRLVLGSAPSLGIAVLKLLLALVAFVVLSVTGFFAIFNSILSLAMRAFRVICIFSHLQTCCSYCFIETNKANIPYILDHHQTLFATLLAGILYLTAMLGGALLVVWLTIERNVAL